MNPHNLTDSVYLYGVELRTYKSEPYEQVLLSKINLAKALLERLVHSDHMNDPTRINKVSKAIKFNTSLLQELGYSLKDISIKLKGD